MRVREFQVEGCNEQMSEGTAVGETVTGNGIDAEVRRGGKQKG